MGFHFLYGNHLNPFLQKNERKSYYFDWKITVFKNHSKISFHLKFPEKILEKKLKSEENPEKIQRLLKKIGKKKKKIEKIQKKIG